MKIINTSPICLIKQFQKESEGIAPSQLMSDPIILLYGRVAAKQDPISGDIVSCNFLEDEHDYIYTARAESQLQFFFMATFVLLLKNTFKVDIISHEAIPRSEFRSRREQALDPKNRASFTLAFEGDNKTFVRTDPDLSLSLSTPEIKKGKTIVRITAVPHLGLFCEYRQVSAYRLGKVYSRLQKHWSVAKWRLTQQIDITRLAQVFS